LCEHPHCQIASGQPAPTASPLTGLLGDELPLIDHDLSFQLSRLLKFQCSGLDIPLIDGDVLSIA
jgi:hypothetical protein